MSPYESLEPGLLIFALFWGAVALAAYFKWMSTRRMHRKVGQESLARVRRIQAEVVNKTLWSLESQLSDRQRRLDELPPSASSETRQRLVDEIELLSRQRDEAQLRLDSIG